MSLQSFLLIEQIIWREFIQQDWPTKKSGIHGGNNKIFHVSRWTGCSRGRCPWHFLKANIIDFAHQGHQGYIGTNSGFVSCTVGPKWTGKSYSLLTVVRCVSHMTRHHLVGRVSQVKWLPTMDLSLRLTNSNNLWRNGTVLWWQSKPCGTL